MASNLDLPSQLVIDKAMANDTPRLLVLPFSPPKPEAGFDFLLRERLGRLRGIRVVTTPPGGDSDGNYVNTLSRAEFVLRGSFTRGRRQSVIAATLVQTLTDNQVLAFEAPFNRGDIPHMTLVDQLARKLKLSAAESPEVAALIYNCGASTTDLAVGWRKIYQPPLTAENLEAARGRFQKVLEIYPQHPHALAGLSIANANLALNGWSENSAEDLASGERLAAEAVRFGESVPEAHFALGLVQREERLFNSAKSSFRRCLEEDPSVVGAIIQLAFVEWLLGNPRQSLKACRDAAYLRRGEPGSEFLRFVEGVANLFLGRFESAMESLREFTEQSPRNPDPCFFLAAAAQGALEPELASDSLSRFLLLKPGSTIADLRQMQRSHEKRFSPYIEKVYDALRELGMPESAAPTVTQ